MKQVVPSQFASSLPGHDAAEHEGPEHEGPEHEAAEQAEVLLQRAGQLVSALKREDWQRLRRLGEGLAKLSEESGQERVHLRARGVCRALDRPHNLAGIRRSLIELVGACGNAVGQLQESTERYRESVARPDDCEDD